MAAIELAARHIEQRRRADDRVAAAQKVEVVRRPVVAVGALDVMRPHRTQHLLHGCIAAVPAREERRRRWHALIVGSDHGQADGARECDRGDDVPPAEQGPLGWIAPRLRYGPVERRAWLQRHGGEQHDQQRREVDAVAPIDPKAGSGGRRVEEGIAHDRECECQRHTLARVPHEEHDGVTQYRRDEDQRHDVKRHAERRPADPAPTLDRTKPELQRQHVVEEHGELRGVGDAAVRWKGAPLQGDEAAVGVGVPPGSRSDDHPEQNEGGRQPVPRRGSHPSPQQHQAGRHEIDDLGGCPPAEAEGEAEEQERPRASPAPAGTDTAQKGDQPAAQRGLAESPFPHRLPHDDVGPDPHCAARGRGRQPVPPCRDCDARHEDGGERRQHRRCRVERRLTPATDPEGRRNHVGLQPPIVLAPIEG